MYAGVPNFYLSHGKMGTMDMGTNTKLPECKQFSDMLSARGHAQCNELKGYMTIPLKDAIRLVRLYDEAREKRTNPHRITKEEISVLKRLESVATEVPYIWG